MSSSSALRWALPLSSVVIIAAGGVVAAAGSTTAGIIIAAVGVVDLMTAPFVFRMIGGARSGKHEPVASIEAEPPVDTTPDPTTQDPSYNPYAREG